MLLVYLFCSVAYCFVLGFCFTTMASSKNLKAIGSSHFGMGALGIFCLLAEFILRNT